MDAAIPRMRNTTISSQMNPMPNIMPIGIPVTSIIFDSSIMPHFA